MLDEGAPTARHRVGLARWERVLAGTAGAALMVCGVLATFFVVNQAGSIGLIAVGAVLLLLGLTGQPLQRIKVGDTEAEFYERVGRRTVEEAREDPEGTGRARSAIDTVNSVARTSSRVPSEVRVLSRSHEAALAYDEAVGRALARVAERVEHSTTLDYVVDTIGIECRYRVAEQLVTEESVLKGGRYHRVVASAAKESVERLLLLTNAPVALTLDEVVEVPVGATVMPTVLATWRPTDGDEALADILRRAREA